MKILMERTRPDGTIKSWLEEFRGAGELGRKLARDSGLRASVPPEWEAEVASPGALAFGSTAPQSASRREDARRYDREHSGGGAWLKHGQDDGIRDGN